jgi:hemolysin activation/secretion protein
VVATLSRFSLGIDALGATVKDSEPDGQFFAWLGQFQWIRRLGNKGAQVVFRTDVQLASAPLLSLEKFAVGGANSVRGYRENLLVRDNGFVSSLEFRIPIPLFRERFGEGAIQLAPFADFGRSWDKEEDEEPPFKTISSAGLGLRWAIHRTTHLQAYWGFAFRDVDTADHDLQDEGVHFQITNRLF